MSKAAITVTPWGDVLGADPLDIRTQEEDFHDVGGGWPGELETLAAITPVGGTVLDVGAQYGYLTSYFRYLVGPGGRIAAVEPSERTFALLTANAEQCGWDVTTHRLALGRVSSAAVLWRSTHRPGRSSLIAANVPQEDAVRQDCEVSTLDRFWCEQLSARPVDVLKLDVEGAEIDVLAGGTECLGNIGNVWVEFWPAGLSAAGHDPELLPSMLRQVGFALQAVDIVTRERRVVNHPRDLELLVGRSGKSHELLEPLVYLLASR